MSLEIKCRVTELEAKYGDIILTLEKVLPPPPPPPPPEPKEVTPLMSLDEIIEPKTDEERVVLKMLKAFKKYGVDFTEAFAPPPPPRPLPVARFVKVAEPIKFRLERDEYEKLGKPGLGANLQLSLRLGSEK